MLNSHRWLIATYLTFVHFICLQLKRTVRLLKCHSALSEHSVCDPYCALLNFSSHSSGTGCTNVGMTFEQLEGVVRARASLPKNKKTMKRVTSIRLTATQPQVYRHTAGVQQLKIRPRHLRLVEHPGWHTTGMLRI